MKEFLVGLLAIAIVAAVIGAILGALNSQDGEAGPSAASGALVGAGVVAQNGCGCLIWLFLISMVVAIGRIILGS